MSSLAELQDIEGPHLLPMVRYGEEAEKVVSRQEASLDLSCAGQVFLSRDLPRPNNLAWVERVEPYLRCVTRVKRGLEYLLCVECQDAPGHPCGGLLLMRSGLPYYSRLKGRKRNAMSLPGESGFVFGGSLLSSADLHGIVVVVEDIEDLLRLQLSRLRDASTPLPAVSYIETRGDLKHRGVRPLSVWSHWLDRPFVFWSRQPSTSILRYAHRMGGNLYLGDPPGDLLTADPLQCLERVVSQSRPWAESLADWSDQWDELTAAESLTKLDLSQDVLAAVLQRMPQARRGLIRSNLSLMKPRKSVTLGYKTYHETEQGWFGPTGCVSGAVIRLEAIIPRKAGSLAAGFVRYAGQEVPFISPLAGVEKRTSRWLQELLRSAGLAVSVSANRKLLWDLTLAFSVPEYRQPDRVGWSMERAAFVFPRFEISVGGQIRPRRAILLPGSPADLPVPGDLDPVIPDTLKANRQFWLALAYAGSSVLAHARGWSLPHVATADPDMSQGLATVLDALKCQRYSAASLESPHAWPAGMLPQPLTDAEVRRALEAPKPCSIALRCQEAMLPEAIRHGWYTLSECDEPPPTELVRRETAEIFLSWLRSLCRRGLRTYQRYDLTDPWQCALADMLRWAGIDRDLRTYRGVLSAPDRS